VLTQLRRFLGGAPATLIWDNLPSHHSRVMGAWLAVEYLPGYAHDLDPVEGLWANLKGVELANRCGDTIAEVIDAAQQGIGRVRRESTLLCSFCGTADSGCDRHDAAGSPGAPPAGCGLGRLAKEANSKEGQGNHDHGPAPAAQVLRALQRLPGEPIQRRLLFGGLPCQQLRQFQLPGSHQVEGTLTCV
jgi:hypothetical protein